MLKSLTAAALLTIAGTGAIAAPLAARTSVNEPSAQPHIVLVGGICGPGLHLDRFGTCVPGRRVVRGPVLVEPRVVAPIRLPPPCPRGYVRDPDPARPICYPRF